MQKLEQKYMFEKRIFEIEKKGIRIHIKSIQDDLGRFVPFEEISTKILHIKSSQLFYLFFGLIFLAANIGFVIGEKGKLSSGFILAFSLSFIFALTFLIGYFKESIPFKCIQCEDSLIQFFYNRKNKRKVDSFIGEIIERRNEFLKNKYLKIDETTSYDLLLKRIRFLLEEDVIDEEEYEDLKKKYLLFREEKIQSEKN